MPASPTWSTSQPLSFSNPVLALLADGDGLFAGGLGGVAWYEEASGWTLLSAGLPVRSVIALVLGSDYLFAGGDGGIARSPDRGQSWQSCLLPNVNAFVTAASFSPTFAADGTALAGTLGSGIIRSTDAGLTWQSANFGLGNQDIVALTWRSSDEVVAATAAGLYTSRNAGRAWRLNAGTDEVVCTSLASFPDGTALAATLNGQVLRSEPGSTAWYPIEDVPREVGHWILTASSAGTVLLGDPQHGIWRSDSHGMRWTKIAGESALSLSISGERIVVGTFDGLFQSSDDGSSWSWLPRPPLHDLRRLHVTGGCPILMGTDSPPIKGEPDGGWTPLNNAPGSYTGSFLGLDGALFVSGPDGLARGDVPGAHWKTVVAGQDGNITQLTFLPDGHGWAGLTPDGHILHTTDSGRTWTQLGAPFGILPLIALAAFPATPRLLDSSTPRLHLMAATYDSRLSAVTLWRSDDEGETWHRGGDTVTDWPIVATCGNPPVITIANVITVQQPDGSWIKTPLGNTGIRRVVCDGTTLYALAADALWRSEDLGATWDRDESDLPADRVSDIALDGGRLYAFVVPDTVWERSQ